MSRGIVPELGDVWMAVERRLNDASLNATAPAVHDSHFAETSRRGRPQVFVHDRGNLAGRERVQIDFGFDRNADRIIHLLIIPSP